MAGGNFSSWRREAGIKANGVDLDLDMVLYCQEKGLDVVREDAFACLESVPDTPWAASLPPNWWSISNRPESSSW